MIDVHCHMLPGIDDGAADVETAIEMARIAVADGISIVACTPHIYPGLYENTAAGIQGALESFRCRLSEAGVDLELCSGADTHIAPDLVPQLRAGTIPTLNGSRWFLLEPPHHVVPLRFEAFVFDVCAAGYQPIITHPERLTWIDGHYPMFVRLANAGVWMQLTAGSLTGRFGLDAKYWAERMLDEGIVHLLATDAHGVKARRPLLAEGRQAAEAWVGADEAEKLVRSRPRAVLDNQDPVRIPLPPGLGKERTPCRQQTKRGGLLKELWARLGIGA